ncbi:5' nucleotidase, NT5C type [Telluribacter sp.]|jgi:5'(3')-deoxyribonucleotidase|uniref:5' nucleotidase, NT5C type n=1 Tax=Telluribacter sp. TaxID=1978767 RepID=UPI002E1162E0|nr:5'(3')-deoxyribonucleotidase [Telluribacter sp.]
MLRITFGMDDILADTHRKLVDIVLNEFDTLHSKEDFYHRSLKELLHPKQQNRLYRMINQPGFFADLAVREGAVDTMQRLSRYYDVYIATGAMEFPNSFREKYDWLRRHFNFVPWSNLVFCGDKSILVSDFLVDDQPKILASFRGEGILFSAPHNRKAGGFRRVNNWKEISELFLPHV